METNREELSLESVPLKSPAFYCYEKRGTGVLSQLAFKGEPGEFTAENENRKDYKLKHHSGASVLAELVNDKQKKKRFFVVKSLASKQDVKFDYNFTINGVGNAGGSLRPAQLGATYALLSHWSLSSDVATIVLPTGTGKTETMLVATLAAKARRTLVIVPTIDLKHQIAEKFTNWGILRKLGVISEHYPNPKVLVLNQSIRNDDDLIFLSQADVVISTPAFFARTDSKIKKELPSIFSHVYFDEAHHIKADEWNHIKGIFISSRIVQFTATPYRYDKKPIDGKVIYNYPLYQALEDNCFSRISLISVDERHPRKKDEAIAHAAMERLRQDRANGWSRHKMMVRAETLTHARQLYDNYTKWFKDERITLVYSGMAARRETIQKIKENFYDIVICVDMLKEGFDYPDFKIAAVHDLHKSLAVLLQFIGRFTRTQEGLGDASFIVNYAEEKISLELEGLFQEGSGWEKVISEIADAKKAEAESLLTFLQACHPLSGFDSPDIDLNPKLVYPPLSCVCFKTDKAVWRNFPSAFNLNKYALSQPFYNEPENVFYFTTQKREKVKWARTDKMRDQTWDLIVMHHDPDSNILYIGYTEKLLDIRRLVEEITECSPSPMNGECVFRSFHSIKRLSIIHAGLFKPANHLHRYSRYSGADVTTEISKWKEGKRCQKSDFVGIGYRDGFPVSVGASVKGKIWSPARVGNLKQWKEWCIHIGKLITDLSINPNQLLEDSATKEEITKYPKELIVLATDWSESLYDRIHKLTLDLPNGSSFLIAESILKLESISENSATISLRIDKLIITFGICLGGENGHSVSGLDDVRYSIVGLKNEPVPLKTFFEQNPPTLFLLNGCTISGCIHTNYGDQLLSRIPNESIFSYDWKNVNFKTESMYKNGILRSNSIQEYMMKKLRDRGACIVFNDDNAGEAADIVAVFYQNEKVRFEMIHCKYSKDVAGSRLSDLYEVCGQAIVSLRYKWKPEELLKSMERRNGSGILKDKRFYHGTVTDIENIRQALRYSDVVFEFAIAQPGVDSKKVSDDMYNFLGSVYSTIVEMTETKMRCYFS